MKITSLERFVLETLENRTMLFDDIKEESGLKENVCFNTLQALVIKNIVSTNGTHFTINKNIPLDKVNQINHPLHKAQESSELFDHFLLTTKEAFLISKVALDEKDYKIFKAMLTNLESFVNECHQKSKKSIPYKDRSFIFWGLTKNESLIKEIAG